MESRIYKILVPSTGNTYNKAYPPSMKVGEIMKEIQTLANLRNVKLEDFGIFIAPNSESGKKGFWLDKNSPIKVYPLGEKDVLNFQTRFRVLKYRLVDGTSKSLLIDDAATVKTISDCICDKLGIQTIADEFSLRKPTPPGTNAKVMIWLHENSTLHEYDIGPDDELEFGKKFFSGDDRVDKDDPFALHLMYCEAQKAIIDGRYPCSRAEAVTFAAIQMQIVYGDHNPNVHKPGFLGKSQMAFLPPNLRKDKNIESEILSEHKTLIRMADMQAKYRYIQTVRGLKTYGITFFECTMPGPNPKKPITLWIGITKNGILRVDPQTGETVKQWSLEQLRRWACDVDTCTLDFGDHEQDYLIVTTTEASAMSELIGGYIDIILRNRRDVDKVPESDDDEIGAEEMMSGLIGLGFYGITSTYDTPTSFGGYQAGPMNPGQQYAGLIPGKAGLNTSEGEPGAPLIQHIRGPDTPSSNINVVDMGSSIKALRLLETELAGKKLPIDTSQLTPEEWANLFKNIEDGIHDKVRDLLMEARMSPGKPNRQNLDKKAADLTQDLRNLGNCARALIDLDPRNEPLMDGTRAFTRTIGDILDSLLKGAEQGATGPELTGILDAAGKAWDANKLLLQHPELANYVDDGSKALMLECIRDIELNLDQMLNTVTNAAQKAPPAKATQLLKDVDKTGAIKGFPLGVLQNLIHAALDPDVKSLVINTCEDLGQLSTDFMQRVRMNGFPMSQLPELYANTEGINTALFNLQQALNVSEPRAARPDIRAPAQIMLNALGGMKQNIRDPVQVLEGMKQLVGAQNELSAIEKALAKGSNLGSDAKLTEAVAELGATLKDLFTEAKTYSANPRDLQAANKTLAVVGRMEGQAQALLLEADTIASLQNLRHNAKLATASALKLATSSSGLSGSMNNPSVRADLLASAKHVQESLGNMLAALQGATEKPNDIVSNSKLLEASRAQVPFYSQLSSTARGAATRALPEANKKQQLQKASQEAADDVMKLHKAIQEVSDLTGVTDIEKAMAEFDSTKAELETAAYLANEGLLEQVPGQNRENSQALLNVAADSVSKAVDDLVAAAKQSQKLPDLIKECAFGIGQVATAARTMATSVGDKDSQMKTIGSAKDLLDDTLNLIGLARELALDPKNPNALQAIERKRRNYDAALGTLKGNTASVDSKDVNDALGDIDREVNNLTKNAPKRVGYRDASDALESSVQALGAAITQLGASARSNPSTLGSASKMTSATVGQLLQICSGAASAAPDDSTANSILAAARALADSMKGLLNASMQVATHKTPQTLASLAEATEQVGMSSDELLASLGNTISPETDKSLNRIIDTIKLLDSNQISANASTRDQLLNRFLACARDMARVTTNLVTSAHVSANKQGQYSKEASNLVKEMIHMSKSAEASDGSKPAMTLEGAKICKGCDAIVHNSADTKKMVDKVKKITESGSRLINTAKEHAKAEPDYQKREAIVRCAQNVVNHATALATASRNVNNNNPETSQKLVQCARDLKENTLALEAAMRKDTTSDSIVSPVIAKQLTGTSKMLALATHDMIKASAAVSTNVGNASAEFELKKSTDTVASSIKKLMEVCASMNPAIKDCERAIQAIKKASLDLDKASVAATMGTLEQDVGAVDTPFQELQQGAHTIAQQISKQVDDLLDSSSPKETQKVAQSVMSSVPQLVDLIKATAVASQDQSLQSSLLSTSKQLCDNLDQLFNELKQVTAVDQQSKVKLEKIAEKTQDSIANLLGDLQTELQLQQEMDEAMRTMKNSIAEISKPVSSAASSYSEVREDLSNATKDLATILATLQTCDISNTGVVSIETNRLTELVPRMVEKVRVLIASTPEQAAKQKLAEAVAQVVSGTIRSLHDVKLATQGQGNNSQLQSDIVNTNAAITNLLSAAKQGAVGEAMMDKAIQMITQKIQTLNTASVFAQAGQLDENEQAASLTMSELEAQLQAAGAQLAEFATKITPATKRSDEILGNTSTEVAAALGKVINISVALSSKLQDSMAQQEILSAAKLLAISNEQLVLGARDLHKVPDDNTAKSSVESSHSTVQSNLKNLLSVVEQIGAAAARGESEINNAIAGIKALLQHTPGYATALPVDVAAAAEEVLVSASRVIFSPSQAETTEGAQACFTSVEDLLNTAKTLAANGPDAFVSEQLTTSARATAQFIINLLEITKLNQSDPATQGKYETASSKISQAVNGVMAALRRFPGGQNIKLAGGQNLVQMAEAELLACAQIVDDISKKLTGITPMAKSAKPKFGLVDMADVAASILESATACSKATSVLVQWAVAAHRERVKAAAGQPIDPMSCQGIICASQSVSDSIQDLFVGTSQAAQGKGEEDKLVACANNVASSTSALVSASKVQALGGSNTQQTLAKSAKAVAHSTAKLVTAAQMLSMGDLGENDAGANKELEHHIRILELEKQLEKEKNRAKKLKAERPVSVYLQGNRTSVYGLQPAGGKRTSIYGNRESVYGTRSAMAGNRASVILPGGLQGLGGVRF